jgi:hypothetical protein
MRPKSHLRRLLLGVGVIAVPAAATFEHFVM